MPKIIINLEKRLLEEARQQIERNGYSGMTMRSVAQGCGIGVGTVYNYFASKDELLACCLLEDWKLCISAIQAVSAACDWAEPVLRCMYDQLLTYAAQHSGIFQDKAAANVFADTRGQYHVLLRGQLASPLEKFCDDAFTAEFIAESVLCWSMAGKDFDSILAVVKKLL